MLTSTFRTLASLKLAVVLLVVLSGVLAWATLLEADQGREYAQWYVYGNMWFLGLLGLLGMNILAAALIRFPWRRRQTGFVVTHAGLLVLLAGSIQTFVAGIEGQVTLKEGAQASKLLLTERSVIHATQQTPEGRLMTELSFRPGPVDWSHGDVLDFGVSRGLGLKVLRFCRHARSRTDWVADEIDPDGSALRLSLLNSMDRTVAEDWLTANRFGGEATIGPTRYQLLPIRHESMLEDFLNPPTDLLGQCGALSIHHDGQMLRVAVDDRVGSKIPVGASGIEVEIVRYLPNAKPTPSGEFVSRPEGTDNPVLELKVHSPETEKPLRQIAFAKLPLLNFDEVYGVEAPVKFWYHHPGLTTVAGATFLQTPSGKLYCRALAKGAPGPPAEVGQGDRVPIGGGFHVAIDKHLFHARRNVTFSPVEIAAADSGGPEAAALVEVTTGDSKPRKVWLKRHDELYGMQTLSTSQGPLTLSFAYAELPLGFNLELTEFTRHLNPGRVGNAAFASSVRLIDAAGAIDQQHEISMNAPLSHGNFTFYQSSFQELSGGKEVSVLTAAFDPGRVLKYLGSCMICGGIFTMFYMRSYMFKGVPRFAFRRTKRPDAQAFEPTGRRSEPTSEAA